MSGPFSLAISAVMLPPKLMLMVMSGTFSLDISVVLLSLMLMMADSFSLSNNMKTMKTKLV